MCMCNCDSLLSLYKYADSKNIDVYYYPMRSVASFSLPDETIAMDTEKFETHADEAVHLAHELGHIETGSFYTISSKFALRAKCEARADAWAIKRLIPCDDLKKAVKSGLCDYWDLAEHFNVTESFVKKAVIYYKRKGLI